MKRIFCFLLCAVLFIGLVLTGCGTGTAADEEENAPAEQSTESPDDVTTEEEEEVPDDVPGADELKRARELGLVDSLEAADTVSFQEYFAMLDTLAEKIDPEAAKAFAEVYPEARTSTDSMTRYDAMVALYTLAEYLGQDYLSLDDGWGELHAQIGEKAWDEMEWSSRYGDPDEEPWAATSKMEEGWAVNAASYFYGLGRISLYSGERLFDYDAEENSMRTADDLTRYEAILSVVRLYDSKVTVTEREVTEADAAYLDSVQERIESIRNTETDITYTGTAYYVSNEGSDENDGLSPETAWASLTKVNDSELLPGDAVLFRRGDIFRGNIWCREGVTYSAYGEGEKPRIYGSPENGADSDKWSLWYDEDGVKIWKYYKKMQDCGGIVFNDGDSWAFRVYSYWDGERKVCLYDLSEEFDIAANLEYDLQFYCDYPEDIASYELPLSSGEIDMSGDLFLRCDEGNPGELYDSIEFQCTEQDDPIGYCAVFQGNKDVTIDNLCIMYSNTIAAASGSNSNFTVQNCEAAFVGGETHDIGYEGCVPMAGEGIRLDGYNNKAINNYVHDCFDGGIIFEPDLSGELSDGEISEEVLNMQWGEITISGNVIERCMSNILIGVHCEDAVIPDVSNITISDNDILYAGYGWSGDVRYVSTWAGDDYNGNAITFWDDDYAHGTFLVENNRLYLAKASLIHYGYLEENMPVFEGNTYTQNINGFIVAGSAVAVAAHDDQLLDICNNILRDSDARLLE